MFDVPLVPPRDLGTAPMVMAPGEPLLGVDLRGPLTAVGPVDHDRILVGLGPVAPWWTALAADLDLTLVPGRGGRETVTVADPTAVLQELGQAVSAAPQAALVIAGLLRWSGTLPVRAALDAESLAYSTLLGGAEFRAWLNRRGPLPLPPNVEEPVRIARDGDRLHLTLNRPERRNAHGRQLRDALVAALDIALLDPSVEHVILDGAGPAFCAGGDLAEFGTAPDPVTAHLVRTRGGAARPLHALRQKLVAHLHGACIGAGIELPAFAGRVVAAPNTTIRLPELGMGLIPGAGGTVSIPRRIGRHRTLHLVLTGTAIDADNAREWGLVDEVRQTV